MSERRGEQRKVSGLAVVTLPGPARMPCQRQSPPQGTANQTNLKHTHSARHRAEKSAFSGLEGTGASVQNSLCKDSIPRRHQHTSLPHGAGLLTRVPVPLSAGLEAERPDHEWWPGTGDACSLRPPDLDLLPACTRPPAPRDSRRDTVPCKGLPHTQGVCNRATRYQKKEKELGFRSLFD